MGSGGGVRGRRGRDRWQWAMARRAAGAGRCACGVLAWGAARGLVWEGGAVHGVGVCWAGRLMGCLGLGWSLMGWAETAMK